MEIIQSNDNEIIELVEYGIRDNEVEDIDNSSIMRILGYYEGILYVQEKTNRRQNDIFTKAASLLVAINLSNITRDRAEKANIAISAATKMLEQIQIEFEQQNTLIVLKGIDIKQAYENDPQLYKFWITAMFEGLLNKNECIEQFARDLTTFYEVTARLCNNKKDTKEKIIEKQITITYI